MRLMAWCFPPSDLSPVGGLIIQFNLVASKESREDSEHHPSHVLHLIGRETEAN